MPRRTTGAPAENPPGFWATHDLKERGWTARMIERFLGEHDRERPNGLKMGRRRLPPVKLYAQERAEEAERSEEFILARFKAEEARERRAEARSRRLKSRQLLLESAAASYTPKPKALALRRGAVRQARAPHLPELEATLKRLGQELGGLKKDEEAALRELLMVRLHTALAATYSWYTDPAAPPPKAEQPSSAEEEARPSDWRDWDWDNA